MRVEDTRLGTRLKRPLLITALVLVTLLLPTLLWVVRGRKVQLEVVLDPPRYMAAAGARIPLNPRIRPDVDDLTYSWAGSGVHPEEGGSRAYWIAPADPGIYNVKITVRRAGTKVEDSVSFQVLERDPAKLPLSRPLTEAPPPEGLPACKDPPPTVKIHGRPCVGANLVAELLEAPGSRAWHRLAGVPGWTNPGRKANVSRDGRNQRTLETLVVNDKKCAWTVETKLKPEDCRAGLDQPVFAAFTWQLKGPGHFRFAAKPARKKGVRFLRYRWRFDDGRQKQTKKPQVAHRFAGPPRRWRVIWLDVEANKGKASAVQVVVDRSVPEDGVSH